MSEEQIAATTIALVALLFAWWAARVGLAATHVARLARLEDRWTEYVAALLRLADAETGDIEANRRLEAAPPGHPDHGLRADERRMASDERLEARRQYRLIEARTPGIPRRAREQIATYLDQPGGGPWLRFECLSEAQHRLRQIAKEIDAYASWAASWRLWTRPRGFVERDPTYDEILAPFGTSTWPDQRVATAQIAAWHGWIEPWEVQVLLRVGAVTVDDLVANAPGRR